MVVAIQPHIWATLLAFCTALYIHIYIYLLLASHKKKEKTYIYIYIHAVRAVPYEAELRQAS